MPEDFAQVLMARGGHLRVVVTVMACERSDGRAWGNAEMLPDPFHAGLGALS